MKDEKADLEFRIVFLKVKQEEDFLKMKQQYDATLESLSPLKFIKMAGEEFISSYDLKTNLIQGILAIGTSYFTKKMFINTVIARPSKNILGRVLKFFTEKIIEKNR